MGERRIAVGQIGLVRCLSCASPTFTSAAGRVERSARPQPVRLSWNRSDSRSLALPVATAVGQCLICCAEASNCASVLLDHCAAGSVVLISTTLAAALHAVVKKSDIDFAQRLP